MALKAPAPNDRRPALPLQLFVALLVIVTGAAVAATAAYFELRPAAPLGPTQLTDDLGRTVTVPANPARVVVLGPSILDAMVRLGLRDRVVGVDCYAPALGGLGADYTTGQIAA